MLAVVALIVVGASAAALMYFSGAKIEITPSVVTMPVETSMSAGPASQVPFQIVTAKKTASNSIPSTGTKAASESAQGTITIYNTQSKPQALVAQTRFATPAGLVYKIQKAVSIPAGTNEAPGTVTATVVAAEPGAQYNIGPSSFTVPGLADTPQATAVYGRSSAAMAGGASGTVPVVDPAVERETVAALMDTLSKDLSASLEIPEGYVLLPGAATTTYNQLAPVAAQAAGKADIVVEATVTGVAIPSTALASAIASTSTDSAEATLGEGTALALTPSSGFPATNNDTFTFTLSGTAMLIAEINPSQIAVAVAGKSKSEAQTALASYPSVQRAVLILRPFWKSTFPEDPAAITVTTVVPPTS